MRSVIRGPGARAAALSVVAFLSATAGAAAAVPAQTRLFPAEPALVPVAVAAAFVLPAAVALIWGLLRRLMRQAGPVVSVSVAVLLAIAVAGYLNPDLLSRLKT